MSAMRVQPLNPGMSLAGSSCRTRKSKAARKPAPGELLTRFFGEQAPTLLRMLIKQLLENGLLRCCDDVRVDFARKMRPLKKKWPRPIRNAAEAPPPEQSFYGLQWLRIA
jgi:hypothetical protein